MYHPDAFATLEQAFDPKINADYGAKFLALLYRQSGSWEKATANYHSATPELGEPYERKVVATLPDEQNQPAGSSQTAGGRLMGLPRMASLTMPSMSPGTSFMGLAHTIPMAGVGGTAVTGRTLDSYRNRPVTLARR
jgi:hypothetical protein